MCLLCLTGLSLLHKRAINQSDLSHTRLTLPLETGLVLLRADFRLCFRLNLHQKQSVHPDRNVVFSRVLGRYATNVSQYAELTQGKWSLCLVFELGTRSKHSFTLLIAVVLLQYLTPVLCGKSSDRISKMMKLVFLLLFVDQFNQDH